ncbi:PAS domain-containing protein [Parvibaculum sp.]|uniref:PAS domain-containing protein n=1 Tax=Parvibaculum sp. TaxID=2024848 RepID=UPI0034A01D47
MLASRESDFRPTGDGAILRSSDSIAFEENWEAARDGRSVPLRRSIDLKSFANFARWFAVIEPARDRQALPFRLVGSGFFDFFGQDLTGIDYLTLADPAIRQLAYDCVIACLEQPCGLWQCTPAKTAEGTLLYEYTILPISKGGDGADQIVVYVNFERPGNGMPAVDRLEHAEVWHWLDIGFGVPKLDLGAFAGA